MSRSVWKGPFVQTTLRKKVKRAQEHLKDPAKKGVPIVRTTSRCSMILEEHVGFRFLVHNGKVFKNVSVTSRMVGHKFGEFSPTRHRYFFKKGKVKGKIASKARSKKK